jgi:hypothetical protein
MNAPRLRRAAAAVLCLSLLGGCAYYPPYGTPVQAGPSTYERAFDAALGAMLDQGLAVSAQDRAGGSLSGTRGGVTITANVRPQADGTTRVEFNTRGAPDDGLMQRVLNSYNQRMGR